MLTSGVPNLVDAVGTFGFLTEYVRHSHKMAAWGGRASLSVQLITFSHAVNILMPCWQLLPRNGFQNMAAQPIKSLMAAEKLYETKALPKSTNSKTGMGRHHDAHRPPCWGPPVYIFTYYSSAHACHCSKTTVSSWFNYHIKLLGYLLLWVHKC